MTRKREQIREERRQLKWEYGELFEAITALLFRYDPVGINFEVNPDEYESETGTILPRLRSCECSADVQRVVYQEFSRWFGSDNAGSAEHYAQIAEDIWRLWQDRHNSRRPEGV